MPRKSDKLFGLDEKFDQASYLVLLTEEISENPKNAQLYYDRGLAAAELITKVTLIKDCDKIIADYDEAIRLNPQFADALNPHYAVAYCSRGFSKACFGRKSEAIQDYDEAIRRNPYYADAYYNRGLVKADLGRHSEAIQDYDKAKALNPRFVIAALRQASWKARVKQNAEKDFAQAAQLVNNKSSLSLASSTSKDEKLPSPEGCGLSLMPQESSLRAHAFCGRGNPELSPGSPRLNASQPRDDDRESATSKRSHTPPEQVAQHGVKIKLPDEAPNELPITTEKKSTVLSPTTMNTQAQTQLEAFAERIQLLEKELTTSPEALKTRLQGVEAQLDKSQQNPLLLSSKAQLALETQLEELQLSLQAARSQLAAQAQLKLIQQSPALEHFYIAFQLTLGNIFISAKAAQGEFVSRNETQTKKQTAFVLLEKVSVHIPVAGLILQALALVSEGWEAKKQIAAIKRLSEFMVIATPLEAFIESLARQLTLMQQAELENIPPPKTTGLIVQLKTLKQAIYLSLVDTPLRERAQEQVQRIVVSLLQGELSTQPKAEDIPSFCSYALQRPVPIMETQTVTISQTSQISQTTVVTVSQETSFTTAHQTLITQQQQEIAALKAQLLKEQQERKRYQEEQEQKIQQLERRVIQRLQTSSNHNTDIGVSVGGNQMGLFAQRRAQSQAGIPISPAELQYTVGQLRAELTAVRSAVEDHAARFEQSDNAARLMPPNKPAKK